MAKNEKNVELVENVSEEVQETKKKSNVGQKIKTGAENAKLNVELFWQRNKKRVLVGAGVVAGAVVGVLGMKALSDAGEVIYDEDGEMVTDAEYDDTELQELVESGAVSSEE